MSRRRVSLAAPRLVVPIALAVTVLWFGAWWPVLPVRAQGSEKLEGRTIEVVVGGEVRKAWSDSALKGLLDQKYKLGERTADAVTLPRLLKESGVTGDQVAAIQVDGPGGGVINSVHLKGEDLTRLDRVFLYLGRRGWHLVYDEAPGKAPPRAVVRSVIKIAVTLK